MKNFILIFALLVSAKALAFGKCHKKEGYTRCEKGLASANMKGQVVPVMWFYSEKIDLNKPVEFALFLHGRGGGRSLGGGETMLEHVGLKMLYQKVNHQLVFIDPQDVFFHTDSRSTGQDYWIGINGRDWLEFFRKDIVDFSVQIARNMGIAQSSFETAFGISMGAHGALSVGHHFPQIYKRVAVLSPIFRPVPSEMPKEDYDVFLEPGSTSVVRDEVNMGALFLQDRVHLSDRVFITISFEDFGYDMHKFPVARSIWNSLENMPQTQKHLLEVSPLKGGHSSSFWRIKTPEALNFILK